MKRYVNLIIGVLTTALLLCFDGISFGAHENQKGGFLDSIIWMSISPGLYFYDYFGKLGDKEEKAYKDNKDKITNMEIHEDEIGYYHAYI
ncbi:MAG: hypothetical protein SVZ03_05260 [Spirochaetota bacterium]|nr:hypothetical protein [Spirochaetota bacterium]